MVRQTNPGDSKRYASKYKEKNYVFRKNEWRPFGC